MITETPFVWGLNHLVHLAWPTVVVLVWRGFVFFNKVEAVIRKRGEQFDGLCTAVQNHLMHSIPDAAEKVSAELRAHNKNEALSYHELSQAIRDEGRETRQMLASLLGGK